MPTNSLIIITGFPGSGKTTLGKKLSGSLKLPLISVILNSRGYRDGLIASRDCLKLSSLSKRSTQVEPMKLEGCVFRKYRLLAANPGDIDRNDHSANVLADFSCHTSKRRGGSVNLRCLPLKKRKISIRRCKPALTHRKVRRKIA